MSDHIDRRNLRITGKHAAISDPHVGVTTEAGDASHVVIVVTQAYGPGGDDLVGRSEVTFDGHPAITVGLRADGREGLVHLSPIHGDDRKAGLIDLPAGARCQLFCPVSGQELDLVGDVEDGSGARYYAIYLTPQLSRGSMVMVSNVWGHYHSRIVDDFELISHWASRYDTAAAGA